jgi:ribosomal protein S27AE
MPWIPVWIVEGLTCYAGTRIPLPCKQPLKRGRNSQSGWVEMNVPVEPTGEPLSECKELELVDQTTCPRCGTAYADSGGFQLPLFFHGGYGEATETTRRNCGVCGTSRVISVQAANPLAVYA